jgi:hypothetical protein
VDAIIEKRPPIPCLTTFVLAALTHAPGEGAIGELAFIYAVPDAGAGLAVLVEFRVAYSA